MSGLYGKHDAKEADPRRPLTGYPHGPEAVPIDQPMGPLWIAQAAPSRYEATRRAGTPD